MRNQFSIFGVVAMLAVSLSGSSAVWGVDIGNNPAGTNAVIVVPSGAPGSPPSFQVTADFTFNAAAGAVYTDFTNTNVSPGIANGIRVSVTETFTNTGTTAIRDAMEGFFDIFSLTDGTLAPAFLFDGSSVSIRRNGVTLTPDVHYTLTGTIYDTPANTGFQSLTVTFLSGSTIGVGESFSVSKLFYRPVGSVTDFTLGSAARASQFITLVPEPTTLTILAAAGIGMIRRNRHSGGRIARKSS